MSSLDPDGEFYSGGVYIACPKLTTWYVAETRGLLLDVTRSGAILSGLGTGGQCGNTGMTLESDKSESRERVGRC